MRNHTVFCADGGIYQVYETKDAAVTSPSECVWLIPGTHLDDPSTRF